MSKYDKLPTNFKLYFTDLETKNGEHKVMGKPVKFHEIVRQVRVISEPKNPVNMHKLEPLRGLTTKFVC